MSRAKFSLAAFLSLVSKRPTRVDPETPVPVACIIQEKRTDLALTPRSEDNNCLPLTRLLELILGHLLDGCYLNATIFPTLQIHVADIPTGAFVARLRFTIGCPYCVWSTENRFYDKHPSPSTRISSFRHGLV